MNIDKAIRKRKKSFKKFLLSMCFIFFVLPAALFISKEFYMFYILYLIIVEFLIVIAVFISISNESVRFDNDAYRLKISLGLTKQGINITPDKVIIVHVEDIKSKNDKESNKVEDFKIVLVSDSKFRNNKMLAVDLNFLKKHSYVAYHYERIMKLRPRDNCYYTIIKRGGIRKYPLLDAIYKTCVHAYFTEEAIEKIKFYRSNSEYYS